MLSLSPILLVSFIVASLSDPGYLEPEHEFIDLLEKVHACELCAECRVLVTPRSKHCPVCKRCVERYDHHCPWINNCVGIHNHNSFLIFIMSLMTITVVAVLSCLETVGEECHIKTTPENCPNRALCLGCKNEVSRFTLIVISIVVTVFFGFAASALCSVHVVNYIRGKTTNERFARNNRTASTGSELETQSRTSSQALNQVDGDALLG